MELAGGARRRMKGAGVPPAIQDRIPHNHCFGCGTLNPRGLQIKSYVEGDEAVCTFQPSPDHMAGPTDVVYGGIIAAVSTATRSAPPSPTPTARPARTSGPSRTAGASPRR